MPAMLQFCILQNKVVYPSKIHYTTTLRNHPSKGDCAAATSPTRASTMPLGLNASDHLLHNVRSKFRGHRSTGSKFRSGDILTHRQTANMISKATFLAIRPQSRLKIGSEIYCNLLSENIRSVQDPHADILCPMVTRKTRSETGSPSEH